MDCLLLSWFYAALASHVGGSLRRSTWAVTDREPVGQLARVHVACGSRAAVNRMCETTSMR